MIESIEHLDRETREAIAHAVAAARRAATTPEMASIVDTALTGLVGQVRRRTHVFFVDVPLYVHAAVSGVTAPAIPLAAATTLLFAGLDIADDLTDGDLPAYWSGCSLADIQIVTLGLLAAMPQLVIAGLDAPAATRESMQATVALGILRMITGQQRDVRWAGTSDVRRADVEDTVIAKSGEQVALFASLAAQLAGAEVNQIEQYEAMGRALGTAAQLASDCDDLFGAPHSRDLAAGTRTLPIVLGLERLEGGVRAEFVALLDRARTDAAAGLAVRRQLRDAGVLAPCALSIEVHRQRALSALDAAGAREPARTRLRALIDSTAWPGARKAPASAD